MSDQPPQRRRPPAPPQIDPALPLAVAAAAMALLVLFQGILALVEAATFTRGLLVWWARPLATLVLALLAVIVRLVARIRRRPGAMTAVVVRALRLATVLLVLGLLCAVTAAVVGFLRLR